MTTSGISRIVGEPTPGDDGTGSPRNMLMAVLIVKRQELTIETKSVSIGMKKPRQLPPKVIAKRWARRLNSRRKLKEARTAAV